MKYQVGDIVLILHSNEEGQVVDIINDKMVMVEVTGVSFPVYTDQIDFPYFKRFTEKKLFPAKKEKMYVDDVRKETGSQDAKIADGVWFTFLPVMDSDESGEEIVKELKLHIVNRSETAYRFVYTLHFFGKPDFELRNQINTFEDFYLHDIAFADLNDSPSFNFEFTLLNPDKNKAGQYDSSLKLKPKQVFEKIEELRSKNGATFSYRLFETYPAKSAEYKMEFETPAFKGSKIYDASEARQHIDPPRSVLDLHIEKLSHDWKQLSNFEILSLQLKTFEKYYHLALVHHQPSLIVIHGVGEGRLKNEIHDILRLKKEVRTFVNQYDPRFGYGATEIFFQ